VFSLREFGKVLDSGEVFAEFRKNNWEMWEYLIKITV